LGIQRKPVAVCNTNGFWDPLIAQTSRAVDDGFVKAHHGELLRVGHNAASTLDALLAPVPLPTPKWANR
jgi:predicted Rossmann-fold nucleotide-binding protein